MLLKRESLLDEKLICQFLKYGLVEFVIRGAGMFTGGDEVKWSQAPSKINK